MNILVCMRVDEKHKQQFMSKLPTAKWDFLRPDEVRDDIVAQADIIIGNIQPERIKDSANLKWLQLNSAGTDGYTGKGSIPENTILTNATGAYGVAISEHMIGSLLFLMKKIEMYAQDGKNHIWEDHGPVTGIYGTKTLVVGCGDIGCEFAKRVNAFGSSVTGIKRRLGDVPEYVDAMYGMDKLAECLQDADIVTSCLPGGVQTHHIFNKDTFAAMKEGAYFLNVGRGTAVDSDALADALNSGHLAGAYVDVTDPEPLPADHKLWDAKNVLITPHITGGYHMQETHDRIVGIAISNLEKFLNNELAGLKKYD